MRSRYSPTRSSCSRRNRSPRWVPPRSLRWPTSASSGDRCPKASARAPVSLIEPLDLARLTTQKKVEVIASYWLFLPPAATKAAADRRVDELKGSGIRDASVIDAGAQRLSISLGAFRTEEAAQARLDALQAQGITNARVGQRTQAIQQTALVVRDPPAPAVVRLKELQGGFPGTEVKIGTCDKTS